MTLLWLDGFDSYGTSFGNMTTAGYAESGSTLAASITTSNPATGTHALRFTMCWDSALTSGVRLVLPSTAQTVGVGFHARMDGLPNADNRGQFLHLRTSGNSNMVILGVQSDGTIVVRTADVGGSILASSGNFKLVAGGYNHIEMKVFHSATVGTIEVRVDGITRINATGVNTGAGPCGQIWIGSTNGFLSGSGQPSVNIDDFYVWDTTGSHNNDFLGNKSVFFLKPNGDTAVTDWVRNTGSVDYDAIDDASPDDDTSYVSAAAPAALSEFDLEDVIGAVTAISAVRIFARAKKTDSGDGSLRLSLLSGASVGLGADNPLSTAYAGRGDIFETDPATGAPMTPSAFNGMKLRLTRTL